MGPENIFSTINCASSFDCKVGRLGSNTLRHTADRTIEATMGAPQIAKMPVLRFKNQGTKLF